MNEIAYATAEINNPVSSYAILRLANRRSVISLSFSAAVNSVITFLTDLTLNISFNCVSMLFYISITFGNNEKISITALVIVFEWYLMCNCAY